MNHPRYNSVNAVSWYEFAAEFGIATAQCQLGFMYYNGPPGVAENKKEAMKWFTLAAENGSLKAQYELGKIYMLRNIVKQDTEKGMRWLNRAAKYNYSFSQYYLELITNNPDLYKIK